MKVTDIHLSLSAIKINIFARYHVREKTVGKEICMYRFANQVDSGAIRR